MRVEPVVELATVERTMREPVLGPGPFNRPTLPTLVRSPPLQQLIAGDLDQPSERFVGRMWLGRQADERFLYRIFRRFAEAAHDQQQPIGVLIPHASEFFGG